MLSETLKWLLPIERSKYQCEVSCYCEDTCNLTKMSYYSPPTNKTDSSSSSPSTSIGSSPSSSTSSRTNDSCPACLYQNGLTTGCNQQIMWPINGDINNMWMNGEHREYQQFIQATMYPTTHQAQVRPAQETTQQQQASAIGNAEEPSTIGIYFDISLFLWNLVSFGWLS